MSLPMIASFLLFFHTQILTTTANVYLDCDTRNFTTACVTSSLTILNRHEKVSTNHTKIFELIITNATVNYLPSNLAEIFPNLTRLEVINSSLLEINSRDLNFQNLSVLDLSQNKIQKIGLNFFNKNLKILRLNGNEIYQIHPQAFDFLPHIQELKLDDNLCIIEDEPNVRIMMEEVKKNCSIATNESMTFLINVRNIDATAVVVMVVIGLLIIAIVVVIILRLHFDRSDYDVRDFRKGDFVFAYEMDEKHTNPHQLYPSLSGFSLNKTF